MKKGWEYKKLGEVCEIYQPQTIASNHLKKDGKYPVFGANGMIGRYDSYNHEEPEVLLCCRGATCGAINVSFPFSWINGNAMVVKPINDSYLKAFLRYLLLTLDYSHIITGAAQPQITRKSLSPVTVPVPPLPEQQRIVDYLDSAFAKIDAMKANAERALNEAKALFQASLKEMLEPKEGWEEKKVKDLSLLITKGSSPKWQGNSYVNSEGILFVTSENVREGCLEFNPAKFVDNSFNIKQRRSILKKFDVLVNIVGASIGRAAVFDLDVENANINQAVCLIRLDWDKLLPAYLCFFLNSEHAFKQYVSMVKDTARANLSLENIGSLEICIPPLSEQQSIVATLDSLKSKVDRLQANYEKISQECDALKQSILRQVFE